MKLYHYRHCPFCIRVTLYMAHRNIHLPHEVLANDNEKTPIQLVGQKMVPILEFEDGTAMGESLDIIHHLEKHYSPIFSSTTADPNILTWMEQVSPLYKALVYPRWIKQPYPEFNTPSAIEYFTHKKQKTIGDFNECLANTPQLITQIQPLMQSLNQKIKALNTARLNYTDLYLYPILHGLKLVEELEWPDQVELYWQNKHRAEVV